MKKIRNLFGLIIILISLSSFIGCIATQEVEQVDVNQINQNTNQIENSKDSEIVINEPNKDLSDDTIESLGDNDNKAPSSQFLGKQELSDDTNLPIDSLKQEPNSVNEKDIPAVEKFLEVQNSILPKNQLSTLGSGLTVGIVKPLDDNTIIDKPNAETISRKTNDESEKLREDIQKKDTSLEEESLSSQIETNFDTNSNIPVVENSFPIPEPKIERPIMIPIFYLSCVIVILIIILIIFYKKQKKLENQLKSEKNKLKSEKERVEQLGITDIESAQIRQKELKTAIDEIESNLIILKKEWVDFKGEENSLETNCSKLDKKIENQKLKLARAKELYRAIEHAVTRFHETDIPDTYYRPLSDEELVDLNSIAPTIMLNLNYMNYQDLRKEFNANQKQIDILLEDYSKRYTTKANQSIYKLMVISLRSELQNILYNLKYEKLDNALFQVQSLIAKYLVIASDGNQQIAGTMRRFVGELEHLFNNSVKIEYEYYIKKEQARQEQFELRQQMREEAEEAKQLAKQREQIAFEESKYQSEIEKIQELLNSEPADSPKRSDIIAKLEELHIQLAQVEEKKEEITKLQKGKAGNVYIISNLGSFGDHVFKIGMTRRLDPQERVNELGSASVPFKYDVHSFIFSEDAVGLENELHQRLHKRRLNKVNLRKEFFDISLEELEQLVEEINPTAEFNRTMLAEDYNQSLSMGDQEISMVNVDDKIQNAFEEEDDDVDVNDE